MEEGGVPSSPQSERPYFMFKQTYARQLLLQPDMSISKSGITIRLFPSSIRLMKRFGAIRDPHPLLICIPASSEALKIKRDYTLFSESLTDKLDEFDAAHDELQPDDFDGIDIKRREHWPLAVSQYAEALEHPTRLATFGRENGISTVQLLNADQFQPQRQIINVFDFQWPRRSSKTFGFLEALLRTSRNLEEPRFTLFICQSRGHAQETKAAFLRMIYAKHEGTYWDTAPSPDPPVTNPPKIVERCREYGNPWLGPGHFSDNDVSWQDRVVFTTMIEASQDLLCHGELYILEKSVPRKNSGLRPRDTIIFFDEYDYLNVAKQASQLFQTLSFRGAQYTLILTSTPPAQLRPLHHPGYVSVTTYHPIANKTQGGPTPKTVIGTIETRIVKNDRVAAPEDFVAGEEKDDENEEEKDERIKASHV